MQLNPKALGGATAVFAGAVWFIAMAVSLIAGVGVVTLTTLGSFHPFFSYSWGGLVVIVTEHLIGGFVVGYVLARLYNKFLTENPR
ncbi:MAG: hypothetical protein V1696_01720 [Candidatus Jorgensenbacteria bacterium]